MALRKIFIALIWIGVCSTSVAQSLADSIRTAVSHQLQQYPASTLQDIYKNFFQDRLGPGHLLADTAGAGQYLREELRSPYPATKYYEPIGYTHNYYRVDLAVVWDSIVCYAQLMEAFTKSTQSITPANVERWKKEWQTIETVIAEMNLNLINYDTDKAAIDNMLEQGKYMMRHSKTFNNNYQPHYRIIEKHIFEQLLLPAIEQKTSKQKLQP
jgi:hypothetical protein